MNQLLRMKLFFAVMYAVLLLPFTAFAEKGYPVGFTQMTCVFHERRLRLTLWYPAAGFGNPGMLGENEVFWGFEGIADAMPAEGVFPLVVLSHGLNGQGANYSWLASALARHGVVVAAPDHPGTSFAEPLSGNTSRLWERPKDISRVVSWLLVDNRWKTVIDPHRIAVIGHSMGGYTALAAAGARFDPKRFERYCALWPERAACSWYVRNAVGTGQDAVEKIAGDYKDPRIRAVVLLDVGFAQALAPERLASLDLPVFVIGAGADSAAMPLDEESRYLMKKLPSRFALYREFDDAGHFSFFQECKPEGGVILNRKEPGAGVLCTDGGGRSRGELHAEFIALIVAFLKRADILF